VYEQHEITDGILTNVTGRLTVTVRASYAAEKPAWIATTELEPFDARRAHVDTAVIRQSDLRPIRYAFNAPRMKFAQTFSEDSVWETFAVTGPRSRSLTARGALPRSPSALLLPSWDLSELGRLTQALPLERSWRGSLYQVLLIAIANPRLPWFVPIDLRVVGQGRVTAPAGTFDCWKVEVRGGKVWGDELFWVSKDRGWTVKTEQRAASDWVREQVLASYVPTPPAP
jgi:hypothetical protein